MAKIEARINVEADSHWYKSKYMLAFPFVRSARANAFLEDIRKRDPHLIRDHEPKCLDLKIVDEKVSHLIVETSELDKVAHFIDIIDGAMKGLGLDGKVIIENNKIEVIL